MNISSNQLKSELLHLKADIKNCYNYLPLSSDARTGQFLDSLDALSKNANILIKFLPQEFNISSQVIPNSEKHFPSEIINWKNEYGRKIPVFISTDEFEEFFDDINNEIDYENWEACKGLPEFLYIGENKYFQPEFSNFNLYRKDNQGFYLSSLLNKYFSGKSIDKISVWAEYSCTDDPKILWEAKTFKSKDLPEWLKWKRVHRYGYSKSTNEWIIVVGTTNEFDGWKLKISSIKNDLLRIKSAILRCK